MAGAQSDNPLGSTFQTEKQRADGGLPKKPAHVRRYVRLRHHHMHHMRTYGMGSPFR